MEYQKIANLLDDNKSNQPSKFRTKNWVEISSVKCVFLARNEIGIFQIFNHVKTIKNH